MVVFGEQIFFGSCFTRRENAGSRHFFQLLFPPPRKQREQTLLKERYHWPSADYLRQWMPFEEICSKPCSTGRDKDCKEIVRAIDSGGQNAHELGHVDQWCKENCDANNVKELKGVMREMTWCAMLLILFSTITISVSFNRKCFI